MFYEIFSWVGQQCMKPKLFFFHFINIQGLSNNVTSICAWLIWFPYLDKMGLELHKWMIQNKQKKWTPRPCPPIWLIGTKLPKIKIIDWPIKQHSICSNLFIMQIQLWSNRQSYHKIWKKTICGPTIGSWLMCVQLQHTWISSFWE